MADSLQSHNQEAVVHAIFFRGPCEPLGSCRYGLHGSHTKYLCVRLPLDRCRSWRLGTQAMSRDQACRVGSGRLDAEPDWRICHYRVKAVSQWPGVIAQRMPLRSECLGMASKVVAQRADHQAWPMTIAILIVMAIVKTCLGGRSSTLNSSETDPSRDAAECGQHRRTFQAPSLRLPRLDFVCKQILNILCISAQELVRERRALG